MSSVGRPVSKVPEHDLRRSVRARTLFGGRIVFHDGVYSYDCIVRDMSEGGARLEIPEARMIPRRFYFLTTKAEVAYDSELVWRTRMMAGVKFRLAIQIASCNDPKLRYLKNIAAELCPDTWR
jgi:hypothetical protein